MAEAVHLEKLTKEDFSKCLNQKFLIYVNEQEPVETELIEVRGLTAPDASLDLRQPFSVIFRGPKDVQLQQGTFTVANETLGEIGIFLVTLGPGDEGMRHESVFG